MSTSVDRLRSIVEEETAHFCATEQVLQQSMGQNGRTYEDPSIHARLTNCGRATALIQHNLREHHTIATQRIFGEPPLAPRLRYNSRRFGHVLLRTNDTLIDPTYGQLFSYVGLTPSQSHETFAYSGPLSLTIDLSQPGAALEPLVDDLHAASQLEIAQLDEYGPLRGKGRQAIKAVIYDIYNPGHYIPYEVERFHPSYDYTEALKQVSDSLRTP